MMRRRARPLDGGCAERHMPMLPPCRAMLDAITPSSLDAVHATMLARAAAGASARGAVRKTGAMLSR